MVRYSFCSLPCTLAKEVQLFLGLGLYSGMLALYFQCQSNKSTGTGRPANIVFYAICVHFVLSTADFVSDLAAVILDVSNDSIRRKNIIFLSVEQKSIGAPILSLLIVQGVTSGCCDSRPMYPT